MSELCDFVISYTAADRAWAAWIAWELQRESYAVVFYKQDFVAANVGKKADSARRDLLAGISASAFPDGHSHSGGRRASHM